MAWRVFSDFDNTISLGDVTDRLLQRFAAPTWQDIEAQWERGEIGSHACMERQIALVSASQAEVDSLADDIEIDPDFADFAGYCTDRKIPLTILSDGLDYLIQRILNRYGLGHLTIIAGNLTQTSERSWQLTAPHALPICPSNAVTCKCAAAQNNGGHSLLYIGDGRSDFCVTSKRATLTLAKTSLLKYCQEQQLPHLPFHGFGQATQILHNLLDEDKNNPSIERTYHANHA